MSRVTKLRFLPATLCSVLLAACGGSGSDAAKSSGVPVLDPIAPTGGNTFPLRASANGRFLVDAQGKPFFMQGDAGWSLLARLPREQIVEYLDDRAQRGFNTIIVNLIEHEFTDNPPDNAYGEGPFLTRNDFSTPNEKYFAHAEFAIVEAEKRGIVVLLAPAYLGYDGGSQGWYEEMKTQDLARLRDYGRFVAQRFANRRNIIWVHGGDYDPPNMDLTVAVAEGVREFDTRSLSTYHGGRGSTEMNRRTPRPTWLTLDNVYTHSDDVVPSALAQYKRATAPFILVEAAYDALGVDSNGVRRQAYQSVFSGACGHLIGHDGIWRFAPGWRVAMDSGAAHTLVHLPELLAKVGWPDLVPDPAGSFVVGGNGAEALAVASSRSADHHRGVVYVPEHRAVTIDLGALAGKHIQAHVFDPTTGVFTDLPDGSLGPGGPRQIAPPPGLGGPDWVIVLESGA